MHNYKQLQNVAAVCMRNIQQPPAYIINSAFTEPRHNIDYDY